MWAKIMQDRFGAKDPRSLRVRTHCQTAGVSLTAQQPLNNSVRVSLQALTAVLGGTHSLHSNRFDETFALPTQEAATLALRNHKKKSLKPRTNINNALNLTMRSSWV